MADVTVGEEMIETARRAVDEYIAEREAARKAESERVFGHSGAFIPGEAPDMDEMMRRALNAALAHLRDVTLDIQVEQAESRIDVSLTGVPGESKTFYADEEGCVRVRVINGGIVT